MDNVYVVLVDRLADWEIGFLTAHLNEPEFQKRPGTLAVRTVAASTESVATLGGLRVVPDETLADADLDGAALLVLPGSPAWSDPPDDTRRGAVEAAGRRLAAGRPVAAICGATLGLAQAGLLNDRPHTGNALEELLGAPAYRGEEFVAERAVSDGTLVTASGLSPLEFTREVFRLLDVYEPDVLASWYDMYVTGAWTG